MADIFEHRERKYRRTVNVVTDRMSSRATIATNIPRSVYDEFEQLAEERNLTKGELMRALVIRYILDMRDS